MFDLKCKWLQWSGCSWSHLEATSRLQENQSTIGHLQRSFLCCLIFLIRDGKDHIEHQWLMMISRSGSCVIVSGPIWTWQSRTTIGYDFDTTKKRWPSKKRHRCVDDTQWCVSHWGSHLTGLAALNEGAFHVLQPEERDTFGLLGDWGDKKGPKHKKTEMFEEEEDFWSLITWTVLEVRPEKDKCKLRKIDGRKAHHNRIFHKFTAPFLDFFQLAIFRRRSHKFSTCASSHSWLWHISSFQPFVINVRRKFFSLPVTAEGRNFLTAPEAWIENISNPQGMEGKSPFENILEIENILVAKIINTFAEEMRFFKPSTLLLKCLAWSSRLEEETF